MAALATATQDRQAVVEALLPLVRPLMTAMSDQRVKVDDRTRSALSELHGDAASGWKGYIGVDAATVARIGDETWKCDITQGRHGSSEDVRAFKAGLQALVDKCISYSGRPAT